MRFWMLKRDRGRPHDNPVPAGRIDSSDGDGKPGQRKGIGATTKVHRHPKSYLDVGVESGETSRKT